ncbi:hypothetical protein F7D09_1911 [Bifidobacterium leontopitheci]|uniref:Uncharacterized protein n=1 Tax=Bifidobacterium leontopitheci TaxID=2650774 RepID=A0A6I1GJQ0_9BIFI|nr:hypothetical protein F7D09_1911 [Bifidobacterium leontopitheci]
MFRASSHSTKPAFTWNRAHWIGMVALFVLLLMLVMGSNMFVPEEGYNDALKMTPPDRFVWLTSMTVHWPIALAAANLILGLIRTGSPSFPLASALLGPLGFGWANMRLTPTRVYRDWDDWLALMRSDGLRPVGQTMYGMAVLTMTYLSVAFICYAIGRYGLRVLFVDPDPRSMSGRLLAWVRADTVRFGCWLTLAVTYGLLLAMIIIPGQGMAGVLMINFVVPPVLLVTCGAYASRTAALTHPWRTLLFPCISVLASVPLLGALIMPYQGVCEPGRNCMQVTDGWYVSWDALDDIRFFVMLFAVAAVLGFGAVWLIHRFARAFRRSGHMALSSSEGTPAGNATAHCARASTTTSTNGADHVPDASDSAPNANGPTDAIR